MLCELWTSRNTHDKDRFQGVARKRRQTQEHGCGNEVCGDSGLHGRGRSSETNQKKGTTELCRSLTNASNRCTKDSSTIITVIYLHMRPSDSRSIRTLHSSPMTQTSSNDERSTTISGGERDCDSSIDPIRQSYFKDVSSTQSLNAIPRNRPGMDRS
jgi:hypothetical protein